MRQPRTISPGMVAVRPPSIRADLSPFFGRCLMAVLVVLVAGFVSPQLRALTGAAGEEPLRVSSLAAGVIFLSAALLILTFIKGAFAWEIVINTGTSAVAASRVPGKDYHLHRPPGVNPQRVSSARPHPLSRLPDPRLQLRLPRPPVPASASTAAAHLRPQLN